LVPDDGDDDMELVNVSLVGGGAGELYSLFGWLQHADELRGRVSAPATRPAPHEMGGAIEILSVALGGGSVGAVLAGALTTWLQTRRARISVEIVEGESGETVRRVEVDAGSPAVTERLLRGVLVAGEESR
jgi:hypothetical protein